MINYKENLRKRIIFIIVGVLCYYFAFIPISISSLYLLPGVGLSYFSILPLPTLISFGLLFYFIYRALFVVKPSLAPLIKKYKKILLVTSITFLTLMIFLPSGIIVPEWKQGQCTISSEIIMQDGSSSQGSKSTSQGIKSISECLNHCKYFDNFNLKSKTTCEFQGFFDSDSIVIDNHDALESDRRTFDGTRIFDGKISR